jgi:hypothetical protein
VLLKNKAPAGSSKPLLPLDKSSLKKLCVLGPLSHSAEHMMGNYYGNFDAKLAATPLQGIQEELGEWRAAVQTCALRPQLHAPCTWCLLYVLTKLILCASQSMGLYDVLLTQMFLAGCWVTCCSWLWGEGGACPRHGSDGTDPL